MRTDGLGRYRFKAATSWYGKKRLRVVAPATRTHEDAKARVSVRVTSGYAPLGSKDSWDRLTSYKTRHDPCQKVPYAVNPRILPVDGIAVLNEAIFRVELATGLRYRYVGATRAIPLPTTAGQATDKDANLAGARLGVGSVDDPHAVYEPVCHRSQAGAVRQGGLAGLREHGRNAGCLGDADRTRQDGRIPSSAIGVSAASSRPHRNSGPRWFRARLTRA
jgi:hypothetical protein